MSKSSPDTHSRILLTDTAAQIKAKIRGAVTDSIAGITYDPQRRPGAANLLAILAACTGTEPAAVAVRYAGKGHGDLKADVVDAVEGMISGPRAELERLRRETGYLAEVARDGAARAREISEATLREMRTRIGIS